MNGFFHHALRVETSGSVEVSDGIGGVELQTAAEVFDGFGVVAYLLVANASVVEAVLVGWLQTDRSTVVSDGLLELLLFREAVPSFVVRISVARRHFDFFAIHFASHVVFAHLPVHQANI